MALIGCGPDSQPADSAGLPSVELLPISLVSGSWEAGATEIVQRLTPPPELGGNWRGSVAGMLSARVPEVFAAEGGDHLVFFPQSESDQVLRIDGRFEGGSFDLVALRLASQGEFRVRALFETRGGEVSSELAHEAREDAVRTVLLPFDANIVEHGTFETLTIHVPSSEGALSLFAVDLLKRPATRRLPSPLEPPRHARIGAEYREAVGLLPGRTLSVPVDASGHARLMIERGAPEVFMGAGEQQLLVELARGDRIVETKTLGVQARWTSTELSLAAMEGSAGEARLSLVGDSGPGAYLATPRLVRRTGSPKTVLFITSDTHRADHLGCMGGAVSTPTIDALAARGTLFEDCIATTTITNPSHVSMMTGLSLRDTGIYGNLTPLAQHASTLAEQFRAAGYRTVAAVSAEHLCPDTSGLGQGFERYFAPHGVAQRDSAETIAALESVLPELAGHDTFIWLHIFDAHTPYTPPDPDTRRYYGAGDPYNERLAELAPHVAAYWDKRIRDANYILAQYKGEVTYLDRLLGRVLTHERLRDALIAFTADHGEALGEHGVYWEHRALYPSALDVPLVLAGPGVPQGRVIEAPVQNSDLGRTLLDLAELQGSSFPGASLLDEDMLAEKQKGPRFAIGMFGTSASIHHAGWFLLIHLKGHAWGTPEPGKRHDVELFDLRTDPGCTQNLVAREPERARAMRTALVRWLLDRPTEDLAGDSVQDEATRANVASLGYADGNDAERNDALYDATCACPRCKPFDRATR
jgi:arylsulfatase